MPLFAKSRHANTYKCIQATYRMHSLYMLALSLPSSFSHTHSFPMSWCPSDSSVTCSPPLGPAQWGKDSNRAPWNDSVTISSAGPQSDTPLNHTVAKLLTMNLTWVDCYYVVLSLSLEATPAPPATTALWCKAGLVSSSFGNRLCSGKDLAGQALWSDGQKSNSNIGVHVIWVPWCLISSQQKWL